MASSRFHLILLALSVGSVASPLVHAAHGENDLRAQLTTLMKWWPGEYDNYEQITRQSGRGFAPITSSPYYRVHSRYARVTGSPLGEHVLSVLDYRDDDPAKVLRSRTYVLSVDKARGALRLEQHAPNSPGSNELLALGSQCDLLLQFVGGQFEGSLASRACRVDGKPVEFGVVVGPRYTWFREQPGHAWFEQTKARQITCTIHESADGDMRKTRFLKMIHLHDQGGMVDIPWPDGRTLTFVMQTLAFTTPSDREYPLFRIHEKGKDQPIAYAYAVDNSGRFGINLGWFYTRCYAEGEDLGVDAAYR